MIHLPGWMGALAHGSIIGIDHSDFNGHLSNSSYAKVLHFIGP